MTESKQWVERLKLRPHPEGGWFRETYRSTEQLSAEHLPPRFGGQRALATMIYYLLEGDDFSALHRIRQDEGWHYYTGSPITLHLISPEGHYSTLALGLSEGREPQAVVPAGWLFAATVDEPNHFSLVGCTVWPGFDFADFEMPSRAELLALYPHLTTVIERLTRVS